MCDANRVGVSLNNIMFAFFRQWWCPQPQEKKGYPLSQGTSNDCELSYCSYITEPQETVQPHDSKHLSTGSCGDRCAESRDKPTHQVVATESSLPDRCTSCCVVGSEEKKGDRKTSECDPYACDLCTCEETCEEPCGHTGSERARPCQACGVEASKEEDATSESSHVSTSTSFDSTPYNGNDYTASKDNLYFDTSSLCLVGVESDIPLDISNELQRRYQLYLQRNQPVVTIGELVAGLEVHLPETFLLTFTNWYDQTYSKPYRLSYPKDLFPGDDIVFFISTDSEFQPNKITLHQPRAQTAPLFASLWGGVPETTKDVTAQLLDFSWDLFRCGSPFRPHAWEWLKYLGSPTSYLVMSRGTEPVVEAYFTLNPPATSDRYLCNK